MENSKIKPANALFLMNSESNSCANGVTRPHVKEYFPNYAPNRPRIISEILQKSQLN